MTRQTDAAEATARRGPSPEKPSGARRGPSTGSSHPPENTSVETRLLPPGEHARRLAEIRLDLERQRRGKLGHSLSTPMMTLRLAIEQLALQPGDAAAVGQLQQRMSRQLTLVAELLTELLRPSGEDPLERPPFRASPLDIRPLIERAVAARRPTVLDGEHALRLSLAPEPLWVQADPIRLGQALDVLLEHAQAASRAAGGSSVEVTCGEDTDPGFVTLRVVQGGTDRAGPRAHEAPTALTLVGAIARLHGGRLEQEILDDPPSPRTSHTLFIPAARGLPGR